MNSKLKRFILAIAGKYNKEESFYSYSHPNHEEVFKTYFFMNGYLLGEEIFCLNERFYIDDEGYPCYFKSLLVKSIGVIVDILAYHINGEWEFYFIEAEETYQDFVKYPLYKESA